jgi:hypothetical protein
MRIGRLLTMRRTALALAATLLSALTVGAFAAPASAGPLGDCASANHPFVDHFRLDLSTGGDDLRGNSEVIVYLNTTSGVVELQHVGGGIGNWSSRSYDIRFNNPAWTVDSCTVTGVKVHMISHNGFLQTTDNWNMNGFALYAWTINGTMGYFHSAVGNPIKRFTGSDQWWEEAD